jgi:hypothetical protein
MRSRGFYQRRTGAMCTSKNAVTAKVAEHPSHELQRCRSEICTPVGAQRGRIGSSSPPERSTHP